MNHAERRRQKRQGFSRTWDRHHRVARSRKNDPIVQGFDVYHKDNVVIVPANAHKNLHSFLSNLLPHEAAAVLNNWIDPRSSLVAIWNRPGVSKWLEEGRRMGYLYGG